MARLIFGGKSLNKLVKRRAGFKRLLGAVEGAIVGALWYLAASLPVERASAGGRWLLRRLGPRLDKTRIIRINVALAFPHLDRTRHERLE